MQLVRCALLTITFGFLLITASCGDDMVVPTSGAAGMVISVEGKVTAKRGAEAPRELKTKDVIYVEDKISTAPGAALTIGLTHNNARWIVEGVDDIAVRESLAWTAARQSASIFAGDDDIDTAAAAANVEVAAAETADTAVTDRPMALDPAAPVVASAAATDSDAVAAKTRPTQAAPMEDAPAPGATRKDTRPRPKRPKPNKTKKPTKKPAPVMPMSPPRAQAANSARTSTREVASEQATKKLIAAAFDACKDKTTSRGEVNYKLVVADQKVESFKTEGKGFEAFDKCVLTTLQRKKSDAIRSARGSLRLQ